MKPGLLPRWAKALLWMLLAIIAVAPVALIAGSPYLPYRAPVYIGAGVAGAVAMALLLVQPLLAAGYLPDIAPARARRWHRWTGAALIAAVALHIGGLYLTSPPDALDALLLVSPTPFSVYGVMAMWALLGTALLAALRRWLSLHPQRWNILHNALALLVVIGSIVHALLIEGTMETTTKWILSGAIAAATGTALIHLRVIKSRRSRH